MNRHIITHALGVCAIIILSGCSITNNTPIPSEPPQIITQTNQSTTMTFDESVQYRAILHTTKGDIEIEFNKGETPKTVQNFIELANKNFYDNTIFHRVIKGFMIQGGDPQGDGTGGPGYRFDDEPFTGEYTRGAVAMANAGPNTNGSQFFIMHADYPLPKNYTIFGRVINGLEIVDTIAESDVSYNATGEQSKPITPTVITSIQITAQQ